MAGTGEGKKEEADYKRMHSFPLIRVGEQWDPSILTAAHPAMTTSKLHLDCICFAVQGCWGLVGVVLFSFQ